MGPQRAVPLPNERHGPHLGEGVRRAAQGEEAAGRARGESPHQARREGGGAAGRHAHPLRRAAVDDAAAAPAEDDAGPPRAGGACGGKQRRGRPLQVQAPDGEHHRRGDRRHRDARGAQRGALGVLPGERVHLLPRDSPLQLLAAHGGQALQAVVAAHRGERVAPPTRGARPQGRPCGAARARDRGATHVGHAPPQRDDRLRLGHTARVRLPRAVRRAQHARARGRQGAAPAGRVVARPVWLVEVRGGQPGPLMHAGVRRGRLDALRRQRSGQGGDVQPAQQGEQHGAAVRPHV
mmetsp:Transcript_18317/g.43840  ORF Transcript_18317/g.43840 Transcript_18317/m.43840 type:complete len:294 (+) Transcript_18317:1997-2878(+)